MIVMATIPALLLALVIPFRWTPGQLEVEVSVNGAAPVWFIVDTGAEYSIVDQELASALGIRPFTPGVSLKIGAVELRDQAVMVMHLDNFRRQGRNIVGLIGYDFFAQHVVRIDFAAGTLVVDDGYKPSAAAAVVPLTFAGRLAAVPVTITMAGR